MNKKIVYLTIDDAPSKIMNDKIEYLLSKEIPAIFFCEGKKLNDQGEVVIGAIRKGFIIGNHSYCHSHFSEKSIEEGEEEIKETDDLINDLYAKAEKERPAKIFRFPYGDKGNGGFFHNPCGRDFQECLKNDKVKAYQEFLKNLGYYQPKFKNINYDWVKQKRIFTYYDVVWTYDSEDYATEKPNNRKSDEEVLLDMDKNKPELMKCLNSNDSSDIVLVHDHQNIQDLFIKMIDKLKSKGFEFRLPEFK